MSPEQAAAETELDGRSDLYSLGCVLYEMLVGEPPFQGSNAQATLSRHLVATPPPLRTRRPIVPEPVERAVLRRWRNRRTSGSARQRSLPPRSPIREDGGGAASGRAPGRRASLRERESRPRQ